MTGINIFNSMQMNNKTRREILKRKASGNGTVKFVEMGDLSEKGNTVMRIIRA